MSAGPMVVGGAPGLGAVVRPLDLLRQDRERARGLMLDSPHSQPLRERIAQLRQARLSAIRGGGRPGPPADPASPPPSASPVSGVTMERITNPTPINTRIVPPLSQVRVQDREPIPGQSYNVVFVTVRNSTGRTFDARDGLAVQVTGQGPGHSYPILSGADTWDPREVFVFYFLTKEYYPLEPVQSAGFEFNFVNPRVVAIPGPSGFFQRILYDPETFPRVLDAVVVGGPGSKGRHLGLPDTSLWEIIPSNLNVIPL
ncbi:hypothetical protein ElP_26060 [Tautonia plasticadhaerens]|uniref:Uncharacterized protein n=2 Tax=Tautonia plasticadhaerens TaxID=2527974 RepID=A0A518H1J8_9BACT|nr:hypothetical protein ElP_26060 [Tautonia plasticadhaerens]